MSGAGGCGVRSDEGAATAEFAVVLPALVFVLAVLTGAGALGFDLVVGYDAARAAAREAARGEDATSVVSAARTIAGEDARVDVEVDDGYTRVTVTQPAPEAIAFLLEETRASALARTEGLAR